MVILNPHFDPFPVHKMSHQLPLTTNNVTVNDPHPPPPLFPRNQMVTVTQSRLYTYTTANGQSSDESTFLF